MKQMNRQRKWCSMMMFSLAFILMVMQGAPVKASQKNEFEVKEGFEVSFSIASSWEGAFIGEVIITNNTNEVFHNWALEFEMPHEIIRIWNGQISKYEGDEYVVRNDLSNQDIAPHESVAFGFAAKADGDITLPSDATLLGTEVDVDTADYQIEFDVNADWGDGFTGEIRITNVSDTVIEDWKLDFDFDRKITTLWVSVLLEQDGDHYTIFNHGYNANIQPGQTVVIGFSGEKGNVTLDPMNYHLTQIVHDYIPANGGVVQPEETEAPEATQVPEETEEPKATTGPDSWCPGILDPEEY